MSDIQHEKSSLLKSVSIELSISVGKLSISCDELISLSQGSLLSLDRKVSDQVEIMFGDQLIGYGELVEVTGDPEGAICVRLNEIVSAPGSS